MVFHYPNCFFIKIPMSKPSTTFTLLRLETSFTALEEVLAIAVLDFPGFDGDLFRRAHADTLRMFAGDYPGYRACNTPYHDLSHTLSVLLAAARLAHGVHLGSTPLTDREYLLVVLAALFHDIGFIQDEEDTQGTGAKLIRTHVQRSIAFMRAYLGDKGLTADELTACEHMILCTELSTEIEEIPFPSDREKTLGRILGAADLLGQMADEVYVEKLVNLYKEFVEGGVNDFTSEYDLLRKTTGFYKFMRFRLEHHLGGVHSRMEAHFSRRHGIERDIYQEAISANLSHLEDIIREYGEDFRKGLHPERLTATGPGSL